MRLIYFFNLLIVCISTALGQAFCPPFASWTFEESGSTAKEVISSSDFPIHNNYNKPERVTGAIGKALRLDGFSTWVSGGFSMPSTRSFSISVWYATEAYPTETAAIINQQDASRGFSLQLNKYGFLTFLFHADGTTQSIDVDTALPKYQWNLITATADLDLKIMRLMINKNIVREATLPSLNAIEWSTGGLKIGMHNQSGIFANLWPTGVLNGIIDEISLYKCALTLQHVDEIFGMLPSYGPDLSIPESRHASDPIRPEFHAMPRTSWTNEPYGLLYHEGYYHLFYQKNPNGPYHFNLHWGHLRSKDLVKWEDQPIALAPEPGWDQHGIWSGHVVNDNNNNVLAFYTGVDGIKAGIGLATPDKDLITWTKHPSNPLIANPPPTYNHMDFRDPFVWQYHEKWYMIVGSGIRDVGGILMTYTSPDMLHWDVATPLFYDNFSRSGIFWEMPAFFRCENKWILLINTVPTPEAPAETLYWVGTWTGGKFKPDHELPEKFDLINGPFLAPSISVDAEARITAIGIIPETRSSESQNASGWTHLYSLPREIRLLEDGKVGQSPHPNLCRLRTDKLENISALEITEGSFHHLPHTKGKKIEIHAKIHVNADEFRFTIRQSADGYESTSIIFDEVSNKVIVDRRNSSISEHVIKDVKEGAYVFSKGDTLDLRLFVDKSVVEMFVDDLISFSTRIYPTLTADLYDITARNGHIKIVDLVSWSLDTASTSTEVCEWEKSRKRFRTEIISGTEPHNHVKAYTIYPNPADDFAELNLNGDEQPAEIIITDLKGSIIFVTFLREPILNVKHLPDGLFILHIKHGSQIMKKRLIIKHH